MRSLHLKFHRLLGKRSKWLFRVASGNGMLLLKLKAKKIQTTVLLSVTMPPSASMKALMNSPVSRKKNQISKFSKLGKITSTQTMKNKVLKATASWKNKTTNSHTRHLPNLLDYSSMDPVF